MTNVLRRLLCLLVAISPCYGSLAAAEPKPAEPHPDTTAAAPLFSATSVPGTVAVEQSKLLQQWLDDGVLGDAEEIVFCLRVHGRDHWYANFGYYSAEMPVPLEKYIKKEDGLLWAYGEGGALCKLNLRTGEIKVLMHDERGGFRDPQVHYDGKKILFSYRPGDTHNYHLYEIDIDGSNLRRLTDGPDDDFEAVYLPDDSIVFVSSRSHRFVNCFYTRVTTLYRMNGDGSNIHPLSSNVEHDNTPWLLPDGRVIYMRWEYVDRSQLDYHHLWTMAPDGSAQAVYFGNQEPGTAMLDAKPIPGTGQVIASFNPGHGRPEHMGELTIVDPSLGPDTPEAAVAIAKGMYRDPYPINQDAFLAVGVPGIAVVNREGMVEYIYQFRGDRGQMSCHEPRLIRSRPREPVLAPRSDRSQATGRLFLSNVYHGRNMEGVEPGEIKRLLVMEQLPKPVNFSGGMQPLTIRGTFTMARLLGTVPVEPDGSAYFEAPALRSLFFVAMDKDNMSVKRMQSFTTLQPGETVGCVGCHEHRVQTPIPRLDFSKTTLRQIEPLRSIPDVIDFARDVQPVLDRHCVNCHSPEQREGGIELQGDYTPQYTVSYWTMYRNELVADGRNEPKSDYPPRAMGTSASPLMRYLEASHHDVNLSDVDKDTIRWWIESSAVYPGTYAALGTGTVSHMVFHPQMEARCGSCHRSSVYNAKLRKDVPAWRFGTTTDKDDRYTNPGAVVNLSTPEHSLILRAPLARSAGGLQLCEEVVFADTTDAMYQRLLLQFKYAGQVLRETKRFDMPDFRPRPEYIREMKRFGILPADFESDDPIDVYQLDQKYWKSFWHQPAAQ
jgi:hypothetical protein